MFSFFPSLKVVFDPVKKNLQSPCSLIPVAQWCQYPVMVYSYDVHQENRKGEMRMFFSCYIWINICFSLCIISSSFFPFPKKKKEILEECLKDYVIREGKKR